MKRKKIILWIHDCPNRQTNINSKNGKKRSFSYEIKAPISFIPMRRMNLWCPIIKTKEITMQNSSLSNGKMNFISKNGKKTSFSYETKASIAFIPMRRMHLWCLIRKRKEIISWIRVCRNRPMNINSKNGGKKCFSYETKASIPFIPKRRMNLWYLIIKRKEIIIWIWAYPIKNRTLIIKILKKVVLLMKPKP